MEPIAIIGAGCILPGAGDPTALWRLLLEGRTALRRVPATAWDHTLYFDADRSIPDRTYGDLGGFVDGFVFDWRRFKVPPADAQAVNPMQWMILEAGAQALGGVKRLPGRTTGVVIGSTGLGWQKDSGLRIRLDDMLDAVRSSEAFRMLPRRDQEALLEEAGRRLCARLKEVSEDNVVGASASVAAGRINMHFDLEGPHFSVDAGFASSLAALDLAVRALRDGELDLAVAGGASELLSPLEMIAFSKLGGLSAGMPRPFAADADGTVLGEGVGLLALKRLEDAERDGEQILGLVLGVGGSSDGRGKSLVAPRPEGQALAMQRALEDGGGLAPDSVDFIECHATGTQVGDASELRALGQVYGGARQGRMALGSVKANLGHLRSAAGAAGLLKAVWALQHRTMPPQPSVETVNPGFELERTPFQISSTAVALPTDRPVRGAVSSFSFGGNNFHAVLESYQKRARAPSRRPPASEPMAIIGLGGMFPGADDVPTFWKRLLEGMDRTSQVPADRYDIERYVDPEGKRRDRSYTRVGCFMDTLPAPDAAMRIPPSAFPSVDPSHVLCLRTAREALGDAGYTAGKWAPERVALSLAFLPYQGKKFLADSRVHWAEFARELGGALESAGVPPSDRALLLRGAEARYKSGLPPITEDTLTGYMGSLNAGRITSLYDFRGPHFVVDAACASAHAAFNAAERMLRHRVADIVLSGGVWCDMMPEFFIAACRFNALSARGSFPFAEGADGFIPGEGAGMVVLKRLSDAERDGDRIRAVLRSVAGASDGKGRSVLAPSRKGEALAMRRTLEAGGVDPHSVDYVECHGTGTALGDVVESNATWDAYGPGRNRPLAIGSVKSNIGHLNAAAGVAGLIKAALAVEQGMIPASLKCASRNPSLPAEVEVVGQNRPWASGPDGGPRRAGVSSFGVGGANFHLVVEEYRRPAVTQAPPPAGGDPVLLAAAGATATACADALAERARQWALGDGPATGAAPGGGTFRLAISARSAEDAQKKLQLLRGALERGGSLDFLWQSGIFLADERSEWCGAKVAFTFPGQGGQYPDMLRALGAHFPVVRDTLAQADTIYRRLCGRTLTESFFTDDPSGWRQRDEDIHAAVFVVNVALARQLRALGIAPAVLVGQSAGELAALVVAQALSFEDGLCAILARTLAVLELQTADPGRMAALGLGAEEVPALLDGLPGYATLAADNGPRACIVSADAVAHDALTRRCAEREVECTALAVSHGYHSQLIAGATPAYRQALEQLDMRRPQEKVISTIDGRAYGERRPRDFPAYLASQFVEPVRLRQALQEAHAAGARVFLEVGPKWSLTQFTRESLRELPHAAMASIHPKVGELEQFQRLLGFCFVHRLGQLATPAPQEVPMHTAAVPAPSPSPQPADTPGAGEALFELPLAEVLGEESARRIATALGRRFGVDASAAEAHDVQNLEAVVSLVERLRAAPPAATAAIPGTPRVDPAAASAEIHRALLAATVAKTGYPQEMLELDLDLEADLGIDTVKQVDIFATVRGQFGIPRDPKLSLRDFNTLRKVVEHLTEKWLALRPVQTPASPAPAPAPVAVPVPVAPIPEVPAVNLSPAPTKEAIQAVLIQHAVEKTGYPPEMLELDLDLEADLGIDTVKQVDIFARTREAFGVERDPKMSLREFNTLRKVVDYLAQKVAARAPAAPPPRAAAPAIATATATLQAAAQTQPAPTPPDGGDDGSVRATLLGMSLDELGIGPTEVQKLARALAQRLGVPAPEPATARSLSQLVALFAPRGTGRP